MANNKLSDWANIAEIVGGIAIVVSLLVLISQVRGNTAAIRSSTYQNVSDSLTQMADFAVDRELVDLYNRGALGTIQDPVERSQYGLMLVSQIRRFENAYYQRDLIEAGLWEGVQNALDRIVSAPGFEIWWNDEEWHEVFSAEFQAIVEELRSDSSVTSLEATVDRSLTAALGRKMPLVDG